MGEIEEQRGRKFQGSLKAEGRYIYQFENPSKPEYPLKVTAFASESEGVANLPQMAQGKLYDFPIELMPTKDDPNKHHRNFVRVNGSYGKNATGPFKYAESGIESEPIKEKPKPQAPTITRADKLPPQPSKPDPREQYWQNKDARDIKNDTLREVQWEASQAGMRWGNSISAASMVVAALIANGLIKDGDSASNAIIVVARDLEQTGPAKPAKKEEAKP